MNCTDIKESSLVPGREECVIKTPLGLLGFEQFKEFILFSDPAEEPFLRLQASDESNVAFLVVSPFVVLPTYQPEISESDVEFLGIGRPEDVLLFNIVTLRGTRGTVNLKGPIVLNRRTLIAQQIIPVNAADYSVSHPLPVSEN